ncbi:hypothetical protein CI109_100418 [Kwoniella shandongensis]|uniref:Uncharacterized protein n=1 Tax=Kwoniella shandongensis TaxID=1734106 RepID=A0A5M6C3S2_9TREE|nr:uncharacterized protein CI109_001737 [Kwoniella shandongensis]KAA5529797.1 hypothetical protein CI109_001737 [Kwoniella shandongensis]
MHNNQYPSDKSLSSIFDPPSPSSSIDVNDECHSPSPPPPAYTALPHRDVTFHLAPMYQGKVGDVELETVDGKRFLVHKKVLENETIFFHIYYGFVPVWRLNNGTAQQNVPSCPNSLRNILRLPKIFTTRIVPDVQHSETATSPPPLPPKDNIAPSALPPPPPPASVGGSVTAPVPTTSPYIWSVPETSSVLAAFLSLIYPRGTFTSSPTSLLTNLDLTGCVVRAALGYQSLKALNLARDHLYRYIEEDAIKVYALASFFKFTDLARLASMKAVAVPPERWDEESRLLMGKTAMNKLFNLQATRREGLYSILSCPMEMDDHLSHRGGGGRVQQVWEGMTNHLKMQLEEGSLNLGTELLELLEFDLRGVSEDGHQCGDCLVLLGKSIQRCLYEAKDLPRCI